MNILITGITGFVGKHLAQKLQSDGHTLFAVIRPASNLEILNELNIRSITFDGNMETLTLFCKECSIEGVIHLASLFLAQHEITDVQNLIESNVLFSTQVLEASSRANVGWFINTGTAWQHFENYDYNPVNLYAATKQAFEDIAAYYTQVYPIVFTTIQLFDTFGPGDTRPKIFNLWKNSLNSGKTLEMSAGEQLIDISYIENVSDAYACLVKLLSKKKNVKSGTVYCVSSPERTSLKKLATLFEEVSGKKLAIKWGARPYRQREVMEPWNKGIPVPGWKPRVSLRDGIRKTLASG